MLRDLRLRVHHGRARPRDRARYARRVEREHGFAGAPIHTRRTGRAGAVPLSRGTAGAGPRLSGGCALNPLAALGGHALEVLRALGHNAAFFWELMRTLPTSLRRP